MITYQQFIYLFSLWTVSVTPLCQACASSTSLLANGTARNSTTTLFATQNNVSEGIQERLRELKNEFLERQQVYIDVKRTCKSEHIAAKSKTLKTLREKVAGQQEEEKKIQQEHLKQLNDARATLFQQFKEEEKKVAEEKKKRREVEYKKQAALQKSGYSPLGSSSIDQAASSSSSSTNSTVTPPSENLAPIVPTETITITTESTPQTQTASASLSNTAEAAIPQGPPATILEQIQESPARAKAHQVEVPQASIETIHRGHTKNRPSLLAGDGTHNEAARIAQVMDPVSNSRRNSLTGSKTPERPSLSSPSVITSTPPPLVPALFFGPNSALYATSNSSESSSSSSAMTDSLLDSAKDVSSENFRSLTIDSPTSVSTSSMSSSSSSALSQISLADDTSIEWSSLDPADAAIVAAAFSLHQKGQPRALVLESIKTAIEKNELKADRTITADTLTARAHELYTQAIVPALVRSKRTPIDKARELIIEFFPLGEPSLKQFTITSHYCSESAEQTDPNAVETFCADHNGEITDLCILAKQLNQRTDEQLKRNPEEISDLIARALFCAYHGEQGFEHCTLPELITHITQNFRTYAKQAESKFIRQANALVASTSSFPAHMLATISNQTRAEAAAKKRRADAVTQAHENEPLISKPSCWQRFKDAWFTFIGNRTTKTIGGLCIAAGLVAAVYFTVDHYCPGYIL